MRKSKLIIYILTGLLLCAAVFAGLRESAEHRPLYAVVPGDSQSEELTIWYDTYYGIAYIFLPGYAQLDQVQLRTSRDGAYQIGPYTVTDGMTCENFILNETYPICAQAGFPYDEKKLMFVRSGGVSTLFLDLQSGNVEHLHADKTHSESANLRLYGEDGSMLYHGTADSVNGRGQSSWLEDKKSYNFTLRNEADLLGLGAARKWVLQANAKDPSNLRNKLALDYAASTGLEYTPDCHWVDLYLNGEYAGLYLLCERVEVHPERVNIGTSGSFLVVKDGLWRFEGQGDPHFITESGTALGIVYADLSQTQLKNLVQSAENAILSEDGTDPVTGKHWHDLIDTKSWVKKYLLEEILANVDAANYSQYYYMDGSSLDQKIFAGPAWDYDLILYGEANELHANKAHIPGSLCITAARVLSISSPILRIT